MAQQQDSEFALVQPTHLHPLLRFFWALFLLLPTLCSTLLLACGLGLLFWLSLHEYSTAPGFELTYKSFNNYIDLARTYLQRQAIFNTLLVTVMTLLVGLPLANLLANFLVQSESGRWVLVMALLIPVTMPTAFGAFAWQQFFTLLPFHGDFITLSGITVVQIWRLLPMMTALLFIGFVAYRREKNGTRLNAENANFLSYFRFKSASARNARFANIRVHLRPNNPALAIALCLSAFLVITNVSVSLIYTNGQAINEMTPLWGQWAFHLGYTSGQFGLGAASLMTMMPLLLLLIIPIPILADRIQLRRQPHPHARITFIHRFGAFCIGIFFILPLIALFIQPTSQQDTLPPFTHQLHYLLFESNYRQWLTNVTLNRGGVALLSLLFGLSAGYSLARLWGPFGRPIAAILVWISLLASPVAFIPFAWLGRYLAWADTRWLLMGFYASTTMPISAWFTMQILQRISHQVIKQKPATAHNRWLLLGHAIWPTLKLGMSVVLIISLGLAVQEFVTAFVLGAPSPYQTLSVGVITELAYHPELSPLLVAVAIGLPTLLGIFICVVALRSLITTVNAQLS